MHCDHNKGKEIVMSVRSKISAGVLAAAQQNPHSSTQSSDWLCVESNDSAENPSQTQDVYFLL